MEKKTIYITDYIEWNRVRAGYPPSKESKAIDVRLLEQKREEAKLYGLKMSVAVCDEEAKK